MLYSAEFSSSLSRNAAVSEAVLKEQTSQLRSAMLTMIKTEAFQPQMRLCSKTVLSAAKIAIASKESPIAHQVSWVAPCQGAIVWCTMMQHSAYVHSTYVPCTDKLLMKLHWRTASEAPWHDMQLDCTVFVPFCRLEAKAVQDLKAQFCSKLPETVTSLDPAFLERIASLKVHVGEEARHFENDVDLS